MGRNGLWNKSNVVVNQVLHEFDANGLLAKDFSNPSGAVNTTSTPHIGYIYDATKSGEYFTKQLRPMTLKYPSGKVLTHVCGTANSVDDLLGRITVINDGATSLVQYVYNGVGTPVKTTYPQPGLTLDYTTGALDRFSRITDHAWKKSGADVVRVQHGYDRANNRSDRTDVVHTANSEVYTYDGVSQIKSLNRGASSFTESWDYDGTGNWAQYNKNGTLESRTHNPANEIQTGCSHDRNGNMTVMPGLKGKYDAWNRLVEVRNPADVLIARYDYNGRNHRVRQTVGNVVTTSFFSDEWRELESVTSGQTTVFIWGLRYIDDLVLREKGQERLYSLTDPNWNVVALTNASGIVQERMRYDAFGKVSWLDAAFATKANSGFAWNRTFTGQVLDSETDLVFYRNRFYHVGLGRFAHRDPIGYHSGDINLYCTSFNNQIVNVDPLGNAPCNKSGFEFEVNLPSFLHGVGVINEFEVKFFFETEKCCECCEETNFEGLWTAISIEAGFKVDIDFDPIKRHIGIGRYANIGYLQYGLYGAFSGALNGSYKDSLCDGWSGGGCVSLSGEIGLKAQLHLRFGNVASVGAQGGLTVSGSICPCYNDDGFGVHYKLVARLAGQVFAQVRWRRRTWRAFYEWNTDDLPISKGNFIGTCEL